MVSDPCGAELLPGLYGSTEGLLSRLKSTAFNASTTTCGYVLWSPQYHNQLGANETGPENMNMFVWTSNDASEVPGNSPTEEYGRGVPFGNGQNTAGSIPDPCSTLVRTDLIQDARLISCCMRMTYTGEMMTSSGEFCFLENLPLDSLIHGGPNSVPVSVNLLFQYSPASQRLGTDTVELVYKNADRNSDIFTNQGDGAMISQTDATTFISTHAETLGPKVFGFAWRGLTTSQANSMSFDFIKNIEWRAEPASGVTQTPIHAYGPSLVPIVQANLERKRGAHWTQRILDTGSRVASMAKTVYTGISNNRQFIGMLAGGAMKMGYQAALRGPGSPLLLH